MWGFIEGGFQIILIPKWERTKVPLLNSTPLGMSPLSNAHPTAPLDFVSDSQPTVAKLDFVELSREL